MPSSMVGADNMGHIPHSVGLSTGKTYESSNLYSR